MKSVQPEFIEAMRRIIRRDHDHHKLNNFPMRASGALDCPRKIFLADTYDAPIMPNQMLRFDIGHREEALNQKILEEMGAHVFFPHGRQLGADDPPDFLWVWDDDRFRREMIEHEIPLNPDDPDMVRLLTDPELKDFARSLTYCCAAAVHTDGMIDLAKSTPEFRDMVVDKTGCDPDAIGWAEYKCIMGYSWKTQLSNGPRDGYMAQVAIGVRAANESGMYPPNKVQFAYFSALHGDVQVETWSKKSGLRDQFDPDTLEMEEAPPEVFEDVAAPHLVDEDTLTAWFNEYCIAAESTYSAVCLGLDSDEDPPVPTEIGDQDAGPGHWMCKGYCPFTRMCYDDDAIRTARK